MSKRVVSMLLALLLALMLLPPAAMAAGSSAMTDLDIREISKTQYAIAPGVTEYEWLLNNKDLTKQMVGHVMEVKVGGSSTASIAAGYNDYSISAIKDGSWGMLETTKQAQNMETVRNVNVVGAVNASGYDMSNGRPMGAFVMNGTSICSATGTTFWIDASGAAHITSAEEFNTELSAGNVKEAVASFGDILTNGKAHTGLDNVTRASRTAVGIKADGTVVFFMVDGRQAPYSAGMTMAELAATMEGLDCQIAINLDGGGSSTFATQREGDTNDNGAAGLTVRCRPSDGYERKVSNTLMVLSSATPTGEFNHAVLTPNNEIYTPGSTVQFSASGVDSAGGHADLPADVSWTVVSGGGSIDATSGLYTAGDAEGDVTVALMRGGSHVGETTIQMRWPDKLGFTNTSVSIDFGGESNLTFKPTYQGREVHYKDGDFVWSLDESNFTYKSRVLIDPKAHNAAGHYGGNDMYMSLNGDLDAIKSVEYSNGTYTWYLAHFQEKEKSVEVDSDGTIKVSTVVDQIDGEVYFYRFDESGTIDRNTVELQEKMSEERLLKAQSFTSNVGRFVNNAFIADTQNSLRGTIQVALKNNPAITGSVDVVVGMEPYMLMDFEDHNGVSAEEYWTCHVGASSLAANKHNQLTVDEVKANRLWVRSNTGQESVKLTGSGLVSREEDSNVQYGQYAFKLCYGFGTNTSANYAAELGFSGDLYVNVVQPTKLGMWVNVPADIPDGKKNTNTLKAILKGGAYTANLATAYLKIDESGNIVVAEEGKQLNGTVTYFQYYGTIVRDGKEVTVSTLGDLAGEGWVWMEADVSALQMPVDMCRGFTVRISSAQNSTKGSGYIYIDSLQFIYGTNTNDVTNPVVESVTEYGSNQPISGDGSTVLESGTLTFAVTYSDREDTDKYASGIDQTGIRVLLDGVDYTETANVEINNDSGSLYLKGMNLRNGTHTITIRLKDFYGNVTTESRSFLVEDKQTGTEAGIAVLPQPEAPEVGKDYSLWIVNQTGEELEEADLVIDIPEKYLDGAKAESFDSKYEVVLDKNGHKKGQAHITISKKTTEITTQSLSYDYVSEIGCLVLKMPNDAATDAALKYTVTKGEYTTKDKDGNPSTNSFSGVEQTVPLTAEYTISCTQTIVGLPTTITVTDTKGTPISLAEIYVDGDLIGKTGPNGQKTYTFTASGAKKIYATKDNVRSWELGVVVAAQTTVNGGKPFGIQVNGTENGDTTRSITWLTSIGGQAQADAVIRYGTDDSLTETKKGSTSLLSFGADALRSNRVLLEGLQSNTTYYYQVGDGTETGWSGTLTFRTATTDDATNFFILGDIQTSSTASLSAVLGKLSEQQYAFGLQTGDSVDNPKEYTNAWSPLLNVMNSSSLNGTPVIHVMGNHEYYSDNEGEVCGAIYDLPKSEQGAWYKLEYGNVCVVVVNHGANFEQTVQDIAKNLQTDCIWKVLAVHVPPYGTDWTQADPTDAEIAAIEKAGFDFVFSGDNQAYARTYPMLGGEKTDDARKGVVYYVCGDLSQKSSNSFRTRDWFETALEHKDYTAMYLTVSASNDSFLVKTYALNGELIESYEKKRTPCELGDHTVTLDSLYDMAAGKAKCTLCGELADVPASISGLLKTTDGKYVIITGGKLQTGVFVNNGTERYHACTDSYAYKTEQSDSRTCVTAGYITYTCPNCNAKDQSEIKRPVGHNWNENHICTVCNTTGIDINSEDIIFKFGSPEKPREIDPAPSYYYSAEGVRPGSFAMHGTYKLTQNNDTNLINGRIPDLYVEWPESKNVGKAEVKLTGRADYYGSRTLIYYIVPNDVNDLQFVSATNNSVTLSWSAASGAEYYEVYLCNENNSKRTSLGTTTDTTFTAENLSPDTDYYFVAAGRTKVSAENDKIYTSPKWSNILCVRTTPLSADVTAMTATVDGVQIPAIAKEGTNYLFLPASADLASLSTAFTRSAEAGSLVVMGNQSSQTVSGTEPLNVLALASMTDGYRTITAKVGNGTAFTVRVMQATNLPTIYLTSNDKTQGRAYVDDSKTNIAQATLKMTDSNGNVIGETDVKELKARGNSTFTYADKKSYQMKLKAASDLLQNGEDVKTWVLLANYFDATLMHDKLFKDLASEMRMPYTASCNWVNLYYDGEYRGVYLLSEKNTVKDTSVKITDLEAEYKKLNPDYGTSMTTATGTNAYGGSYTFTTGLTDPENITGGYLLELNHSAPDEVNGFVTRKSKGINVKSPEWCSDAAMKYISEYYQEFEDAVYAGGYNEETRKYYYDYVDRDSLVKIFLMQELALNPDGFISSLYFYKDANGKMFAGPIWDQDMTLGTGWTKQISPDITDYHYLAEALIRIPDFRAAVNSYYTEYFAPLTKKLLEDNGTIDSYVSRLTDSAEMNFVLWPYIRIGSPDAEGHIWQNATYASVVADMRTWLSRRMTKLDATFVGTEYQMGDVNMDGIVNSYDAVLILRYASAFTDDDFNIRYADINGDGTVNSYDAVLLLRQVVGLED